MIPWQEFRGRKALPAVPVSLGGFLWLFCTCSSCCCCMTRAFSLCTGRLCILRKRTASRAKSELCHYVVWFGVLDDGRDRLLVLSLCRIDEDRKMRRHAALRWRDSGSALLCTILLSSAPPPPPPPFGISGDDLVCVRFSLKSVASGVNVRMRLPLPMESYIPKPSSLLRMCGHVSRDSFFDLPARLSSQEATLGLGRLGLRGGSSRECPGSTVPPERFVPRSFSTYISDLGFLR